MIEPPTALASAIPRAAWAEPVIRLVVLFGSHSRGRTRKDSDIDLAVLAEETPVTRRREIEVALARAVPAAVDVVFLDGAPPQLRFEVARSGVVLFERTAGLWIRERARAMIDWWEWAPVARSIHAAAVAKFRDEVR